MDNIVLIPLIILAVFMVGIAALVSYLLYRPRAKKKKLKPESARVTTNYPEPEENGDVKLNIPDEVDGTMLPPYSAKNGVKDKPVDTKVYIEHSDDGDSIDDDKKLLEVTIEPQERPVDVGTLEGKAPETPHSVVEDENQLTEASSKQSSPSSSSSESDVPEVQESLGDQEMPVREDGSPTEPKRSSSLSSSSTSSEDEHVTPQPMPLIDPHIVRDPVVSKEPDEDVLVKRRSDTDSEEDLVSDVLAAVDGKRVKESNSSSSSSQDEETKAVPVIEPTIVPQQSEGKSRTFSSSSSSEEEQVIPKAVVEEEVTPTRREDIGDSLDLITVRDKPLKEPAVDVSSSDEDFDPAAERRKQPPKPIKRKKRPSAGKVVTTQPEKSKSSSSSSSSSEEKLAITPTSGVFVSKKSSSSSTSSDDVNKLKAREISSQTSIEPPSAMKRRKAKKYKQPLETTPVSTQTIPGKSSSSTSSYTTAESGDDSGRKKTVEPLYAIPDLDAKKKIPLPGIAIATQTDKFSTSSSSSFSSSSEDDIELPASPTEEISTQTTDKSTSKKKKNPMEPYLYEVETISLGSSVRTASITSSGSERDIRTLLQGTPRVGPRPWSPTREPLYDPTSPQLERSTQTLFAPRGKTSKKEKSREPMRSPSPIVITMTDKCIQTMKVAWTSSSSSSSEDEAKIKPTVIQVYEKGNQMSSSSSSDDDISIRTRREVTVKSSVKRNMVSTGTETERRARKIVTSTARHEHGHGLKTISLELQPEEHYKTETVVELPPEPRNIVFTTSWGKPVKLEDLYDAGIVDSDTKAKLEYGEMESTDEFIVKLISPYISSNKPVAGILLVGTGTKLSIYEASKRGLINRGTAIGLLEAEVATGCIIDPVTGIQMTVAEASRNGYIDESYEAVLQRAERAVYGYKPQGSDRVLSIFQAMNRGQVVHSHGMRLLEAQLATGGIIDPNANHRLPLEAAYKRKLFDRKMMSKLEDPSYDSKGFFDPNDCKNLTYQELISKCVTDLETGALLFPLVTEERGRSPTTASNVRSSTRVDMKSPKRSKSTEKEFVLSVAKPPSDSSSSSSSDGSTKTKKKTREIKTSTASIELARTPVMSGDDEDIPRKLKSEVTAEFSDDDEKRRLQVEALLLTIQKDVSIPDEDEKQGARVTSETTMQITGQPQVFEEIHFEVKGEEAAAVKEEKLKSSSSSSSSEEEVNAKDGKEVVKMETESIETGDGSSTSKFIKTTTVVTTTEVVMEKRKSRHEIKFKSGWNRKASLLDLFDAGVVSKETVDELERGAIAEEDVEKSLQQYLVGAEPIAGILISETGEKLSIYAALKRGLIRKGTSIGLLEAQAATGRILDPNTGERMSVDDAYQKKLIDRGSKSTLERAERAVYGYTSRLSSDVLSLFQAMKRGFVMENHGIRLLEAQIATGGIIDPNANHRLPVEVAYERGLFDERISNILKDPGDDTRGFFDPNTEENLTYLELMERCVKDKETGMQLLPLRSHVATSIGSRSKVVFESRTGRQVTLKDLLLAEVVDARTAKKYDEGEMTKEEKEMMVAKLRVFVDGTMPIAGIINTDTGERMSIYEAVKCGLIRRGTAFELLEAQACCGKLIDVQTGRVVTIETAIRSGMIDSEFKDVIERAHRAVVGYKEPFKRELVSLCEAMNRHLVVKRHGIGLLEAQIATGGIVDIRSPVRINVQVALKRTLIDSKLAEELENKRTQSYFDPVTGENLNYSELMGRCVKDKDSGLLYLMVEGGTVTGYVRPFEPEHASKIRSTSMSPAKITTEEVTTKRAAGMSQHQSSTEISTSVHTTETKSSTKKKKKSRRSEVTTDSSAPTSPSIISRHVIILDPNTNEELTVQEALKMKLIDEETARELIAQQGDFEEKQS